MYQTVEFKIWHQWLTENNSYAYCSYIPLTLFYSSKSRSFCEYFYFDFNDDDDFGVATVNTLTPHDDKVS